MTRFFVFGTSGSMPVYHLLDKDGRTVVAKQVSRPEGKEVDIPKDVRWRPNGHATRPIDHREFNNVSKAVADAARKRAGEQSRRKTTWRRSEPKPKD